MDALSAYIFIAIAFLLLTLFKTGFFLIFAKRYHANHKRLYQKLRSTNTELVSVIIPAYNEELVLEHCLESLLAQTYNQIEIVIVDDGSTDCTKLIAGHYCAQHKNITYLHKENGGKASALNHGIAHANGDILICVDADSAFMSDTVAHIVRSFQDPTVDAVAGNVRIANRKGFLGNKQAIEYITGLTLQRQAFAALGCIQVISGALSAFRRSALTEIGGYSSDTLVEDMDSTMALAEKQMRIIYNPKAIAYTEGPVSWSDLRKQRYRWVFGGFQVVGKYKHMLFNKAYGTMGTIGLPYYAVFPWIDVLISSLLLVAIIIAFATNSLLAFALFFGGMLTLQALVISYACRLDQERYYLVLYGLLSILFYTHLLSFITIQAGVAYLSNQQASWPKLVRVGANAFTESDIETNVAGSKKTA